MILKNKKILITGASGFLGQYVLSQLFASGCQKENLFTPTRREADLRNLEACRKAVRKIDVVIHLAGFVGGIGLNREKPGELFYDNLIMGIQLIDEARRAGVKKFVAIGTVCAYPKFTPTPFKEEDLWNGYPEETNAPYGLAKKMLLVQAQAYRKQYGFKAIFLLPVNLYGPGDNFAPSSSHVIPSLIKKSVEAKLNNEKTMEAWGTGGVSREFLYVEDAAKAIVLATEKYDKEKPVNIGSGNEIKIRDLVLLVNKITGFKGRVVWDRGKPDGQPRRRLDTRRAYEEFGFRAKVGLAEGLKKTVEWYCNSIITFFP